MPLSW